jgi:hypothetical protein
MSRTPSIQHCRKEWTISSDEEHACAGPGGKTSILTFPAPGRRFSLDNVPSATLHGGFAGSGPGGFAGSGPFSGSCAHPGCRKQDLGLMSRALSPQNIRAFVAHGSHAPVFAGAVPYRSQVAPRIFPQSPVDERGVGWTRSCGGRPTRATRRQTDLEFRFWVPRSAFTLCLGTQSSSAN